MDSAQALEKIKLLLQLSQSDNENEASNALRSIEALKIKFNLTDKDITDYIKPPPEYSVEKNILFKTEGSFPVDWKERLSVVISKLCYCYIIQEQNFLATGESFFVYYIYGDEENIATVKHLYQKISSKVEEMVVERCPDRGDLYKDSYADGLVEGFLARLEEFNIEIKPPSRSVKQEIKVNGDELTPPKKELPKEKPVEKTTQVGLRSKNIDHVAFIRGSIDAADFEFDELRQLEF